MRNGCRADVANDSVEHNQNLSEVGGGGCDEESGLGHVVRLDRSQHSSLLLLSIIVGELFPAGSPAFPLN